MRMFTCALALALASAKAQAGPFDTTSAMAPLSQLSAGRAVTTCMSQGKGTPAFDPSRPVVGGIDLSNPDGRPGNTIWQTDNLFADLTMDHLEPDTDWTANVLGQVFGLAIGPGDAPCVFAAATSIYGCRAGSLGGFCDPRSPDPGVWRWARAGCPTRLISAIRSR